MPTLKRQRVVFVFTVTGLCVALVVSACTTPSPRPPTPIPTGPLTATLLPRTVAATATVQPPTVATMARNTAADQSSPAVPATPQLHTATQPSAIAATAQPIQPYATAPVCPSDDLSHWHGLWDYNRGCHYAYEQGDDPHLGDGVFGPPAAAWGGQTISWPWVSSPIENQPTPLGKHNGYKWAINLPEYNPWPACGALQNDDHDPTGNRSNCIKASRIELHILGSLEDSLARYHSSYVEFQICARPDYTQCGILRTGAGLTDFAQLQAPHYSDRVTRPGGVVDFGQGIVLTYTADGPDLPANSGEPYIYDMPASDLAFYRSHAPTYNAQGFNTFPGTMAQWSSNDLDCEPKLASEPCHQAFVHFLYQVSNTWTLVDPGHPNHPVFICRDGSCGYTGSAHGMEEVAAYVPQSWQPDGNGFVTFHGYGDRYGNPIFDGSCTSPSFTCVPFSLDHVPVGYAAHRMDNGCECSHELTYDMFFKGQPSGWVSFPN